MAEALTGSHEILADLDLARENYLQTVRGVALAAFKCMEAGWERDVLAVSGSKEIFDRLAELDTKLKENIGQPILLPSTHKSGDEVVPGTINYIGKVHGGLISTGADESIDNQGLPTSAKIIIPVTKGGSLSYSPAYRGSTPTSWVDGIHARNHPTEDGITKISIASVMRTAMPDRLDEAEQFKRPIGAELKAERGDDIEARIGLEEIVGWEHVQKLSKALDIWLKQQ